VAAPVAGGATYSGSVGELLLGDTRAALGSVGLLLGKKFGASRGDGGHGRRRWWSTVGAVGTWRFSWRVHWVWTFYSRSPIVVAWQWLSSANQGVCWPPDNVLCSSAVGCSSSSSRFSFYLGVRPIRLLYLIVPSCSNSLIQIVQGTILKNDCDFVGWAWLSICQFRFFLLWKNR
jgi:hypothetical protein